VFYDGECAICRAWALRFEPRLKRHNMGLAPLQNPWVSKRLGLRPGAALLELKILTPDGKIVGGAEAMVYLARLVWWGWPLRLLWRVPVCQPLLERVYAWFAERRHCRKGGCRL